METVLTVVALLFLLCLGLGAYATVKVVGAAKRTVDRTVAQARRTVEDHTLRAKSYGRPGPAGEIAQLRLTLRTSMRATQDALHSGVVQDESLKESLGLFERLSVHGQELDGILRRLESEPDRSTLTARLPELRTRTERITASADSLRWAVRDRAGRFADDDLDSLSTQIDIETGALRHWTRTDTGDPATPWPEAPANAGGAWPPAAGSDRPDPAVPHAITPPGPRPVHPWQRKPRPETTA
ncbi:hypothetical protein [Streptomyces sp. LaPpAH-108]|uniref:hypothetical protein n=1 Tax=Streptomyces sp. LaPpAH-108 TaxID=1155714 RepID=UPI00035FC4AA|nr:hypothetical protein [Streptomyces sp. LaPpAH-108]